MAKAGGGVRGSEGVHASHKQGVRMTVKDKLGLNTGNFDRQGGDTPQEICVITARGNSADGVEEQASGNF